MQSSANNKNKPPNLWFLLPRWSWWRAAFILLVLTFSISPLFLLRAERVILTVTAPSSPCRRRAMRLGCSGLKEISSSGRGKRLILPSSVEISEDSRTDGQPLETCGTTCGLKVKGHFIITPERNVTRSGDRGFSACYNKGVEASWHNCWVLSNQKAEPSAVNRLTWKVTMNRPIRSDVG